MDEAKAIAAGYGERAPVNRGIRTESARNGEIPKIQTPLFGTMRHPALSGLLVQTFPKRCSSAVTKGKPFFSRTLFHRGRPGEACVAWCV
ncbi:hypothetical protein XcvCFBP7111P_22810 [Xanthomonas citri pv. vignicola]|uniref:Uncharacterized protein n=1 Tax=Xanthomonas citri pv. vignicola TaxID=473426 RepID=A0AB33CLT9_XANCI|nr:hypothetical protein XcvCFBP7111P_22810 [Xanthomonas citri pv. vignicola]